jgi:hypothetical protein
LCDCSLCCFLLAVAASSAGDLRLEALSLLLHLSPPPFVAAGVALLMVASRLIDVALAVAAAAAAAAAATSAAGRNTHDSYGLKLDRAVVVTVVIGAGCR